MDPHYEQRLRDEVIYLHSLWHQGPPRTTFNAAAAAAAHLRVSATTKPKFKKKKPTTPKLPPSSTKEWPCSSAQPKSPAATWPEVPPRSAQATPLTPEERTKSISRTVHRNALSAVRKFLITNNHHSSSDKDSGGVDEEEVEEDDEDELALDDDGREEYTFFFKVFKDDDELREYYEKHYANGDFSCLVCGALGGKGTGKKFKGCLPLVQHSVTIAKTKRKKAHRAFGQVVCKLLGWDIDKLPSVVSLLSGISGEGEPGVRGDGQKDNAESLEVEAGKLVPDSESIGASGVSSNKDHSSKEISVVGSGIVHEADNVNNSNGGGEHVGVTTAETTGGESISSNMIPSVFPNTDKNTEELDAAAATAEGLTIKLSTRQHADEKSEKTAEEEEKTTESEN